MFYLRLIPDDTRVPFMKWRRWTIGGSIVGGLAAIVLMFTVGLNYGIDFQGGIMIEVRTAGPADLGALRASLGGLGLGEVALQEFGEPSDVLIRVERQPGEEAEQQRAVESIRAALTADIGTDIEYRRVEFVGPQASQTIVVGALWAVGLAVMAMMFYIWIRFELPFGVGSVAALIHDVLLTVGVFSVTGLEFNLSTVAAILMIIGYSMNDTVIVYDRVRENLRKYKAMSIEALLDRSVNDTLTRTVNTTGTTFLALFALYFLGGEVIRDFSFAMIWGIAVGTYSSIYIATPILLMFDERKLGRHREAAPAAASVKSAP